MSDSDKAFSVFLGCPTHSGMLDSGAAIGIFGTASHRHQVIPKIWGKSLLSSNCNTLWCMALNNRDEHDIRWFAMLHSDIEPQPLWLDGLIDVAEEFGADMVSAAVPIKNEKGLTSTAIGERGGNVASYRLTLSQLHHERFPESFDAEAAIESLRILPGDLAVLHDVAWPELLLNTGCMICRIDKPWSERVFFENRDWIERHDGMWRANDFSEDWMFSQKVNQCGGKLVATTRVKVVHKGVGWFDSSKTWGIPNDCGHLREGAKA